MTKRVEIVPIEFIHQAWEKVGKWVEDAMEHAKGECTAGVSGQAGKVTITY